MNALHEVRAYSAIANDGLMPHLRLIKNAPPVPPQRAISAHTARELRPMLETVTEPGGSATRAATIGYVVACKTGTTRKPYASAVHATKRPPAPFRSTGHGEKPARR